MCNCYHGGESHTEGGGVAATISGPRRTGSGEGAGVGDGGKPVLEQKVIAERSLE